MLRARDIMTADPACCTPVTPLVEAARLMARHNCGALPVVADATSARAVGMLTDRDIVVRGLAAARDPAGLTVGDCYTAAVVAVEPESPLSGCADRMREHRVRRVLVCEEGGRVIGIVAQADLARHLDHAQSGAVVQGLSG